MATQGENELKRKTEEGEQSPNKKQHRELADFELSVYIYFNGDAKQAIEFYSKVFDAKIDMSKTYGEGPMEVDEDWKDKIMHCSMTIAGKVNLMISDNQMLSKEFKAGNNVQLSIALKDVGKLTTTFNALAEDGKITMPLEKQFWGSVYGNLVDKFGIHWMFSGPYDAEA